MATHSLLLVAILFTSACAAAPPAATQRPRGGTPSAPTRAASIVTEVLKYTNEARADAGRPPLVENSRLTRAAQLHAGQIARAARLAHVLRGERYPRPEDRLAAAAYRWQAYAENLAFGERDARRVVEGWMESAPHRANILNPAYTEIGVGYAVGARGRPYYVQVFGRPKR